MTITKHKAIRARIRILRSADNRLKKANPQFRWHVTAIEREAIRRMTVKGVRQSVIARTLGIAAPSVSKAQRSMGLPTRLVIPKDEIMRLFRKGWGGYRISKYLHVPANQVYAVAHQNKFRRKDGIGYPEPHGDVAAFIQAVKIAKTTLRSYGTNSDLEFVRLTGSHTQFCARFNFVRARANRRCHPPSRKNIMTVNVKKREAGNNGQSKLAWAEAKLLFEMLRHPGANVEHTRTLIAPSQGVFDENARFRLNILYFFDSFIRAGRVVPMRRRRRTCLQISRRNNRKRARQ